MRGKKTGGRQKGAANVRTREIADKAVKGGITPLEVLLEEMRIMHKTVTELRASKDFDPLILVQNVSELRSLAQAAAPYIHPRLQSSQVKVTDPVEVRVIERVIIRE